MQIREMTKPVTSKQLNESLSKKFGYQLKLEQFTDVHLEDVRNKLRTKISQFELNEGYHTVLENSEYQKTRMFLDVINTEIFEREGREVPMSEDIDSKYDRVEDRVKYDKMRTRANEHAVPNEWIDSAISRIKLGESDKAELSAELKLRYDLTEADASWILLESEEMRAEIIMASKDMIDRVTGWYEDVAAMKSEQFLELTDTISELLGNDVGQQYMQLTKPALETLYTTLESVRGVLSQGLDILTGDMPQTMGDTAGAPITQPMPGAATPGMPLPTEMGPEAPETGAEEAGRIKRESVEYGHKLSLMLSAKKNSVKR